MASNDADYWLDLALNDLKAATAMEERSLTLLDFLEPLHIEGRYPTDKARLLRMLTAVKCAWLMTETRRLHTWIRNKLSEK